MGALLQQLSSRAERSAAEARSSTAGWRWSSQRSARAARQRRPCAALRKPFGSAAQWCWTHGAAISRRTDGWRCSSRHWAVQQRTQQAQQEATNARAAALWREQAAGSCAGGSHHLRSEVQQLWGSRDCHTAQPGPLGQPAAQPSRSRSGAAAHTSRPSRRAPPAWRKRSNFFTTPVVVWARRHPDP